MYAPLSSEVLVPFIPVLDESYQNSNKQSIVIVCGLIYSTVFISRELMFCDFQNQFQTPLWILNSFISQAPVKKILHLGNLYSRTFILGTKN
jgi:hypothetical protein